MNQDNRIRFSYPNDLSTLSPTRLSIFTKPFSVSDLKEKYNKSTKPLDTIEAYNKKIRSNSFHSETNENKNNTENNINNKHMSDKEKRVNRDSFGLTINTLIDNNNNSNNNNTSLSKTNSNVTTDIDSPTSSTTTENLQLNQPQSTMNYTTSYTNDDIIVINHQYSSDQFSSLTAGSPWSSGRLGKENSTKSSLHSNESYYSMSSDNNNNIIKIKPVSINIDAYTNSNNTFNDSESTYSDSKKSSNSNKSIGSFMSSSSISACFASCSATMYRNNNRNNNNNNKDNNKNVALTQSAVREHKKRESITKSVI